MYKTDGFITNAINYYFIVDSFHELWCVLYYNIFNVYSTYKLDSRGDNPHSLFNTFQYLCFETIPAYESSLILVELQDNSSIPLYHYTSSTPHTLISSKNFCIHIIKFNPYQLKIYARYFTL